MYLDSRGENERHAHYLLRQRIAPLLTIFADDPSVTEINVNGKNGTFITKNGRREKVQVAVSDRQIDSTLREVASAQGQEYDPETKATFVHGKLPGFRISGCGAPVSGAGPSINIRRHSPRVLSLEDYVDGGTIPKDVAELLRVSIRAREAMLVVGGTDSGKTTLLNALIREIPEMERLVTIEDPRELTVMVPNWLPLEYNKQQGISATSCVEFAMRASPDRIILGEIKDAVAADFLEALNTGHDGGMATIHSSSGRKGLSRLEVLVLRAGLGWPLEAIRQQIAMSINILIHVEKRLDSGKRALTEVLRVHGYDPEKESYVTETLFEIGA